MDERAGPDTRAALRAAVPALLAFTLIVTGSFVLAHRLRQEHLPMVVVASGLALALLVASTIWFARVATQRARAALDEQRASRLELDELTRKHTELASQNAELERALAERGVEVQAAIDELETFNTSVSHDLRSPLGAILNYSSLIEEDYGGLLDDQGRAFLARMRASAEKVISMMDRLLAYSSAGHKALELGEIDLVELVKSAWARAGSESARARVRFTVDVKGKARVDGEMMRTALASLLEHALEYSKAAEAPEIDVRSESSNGHTSVLVEDNGVRSGPQDAERRSRALDPGSTRKEALAQGVGLALVARIVHRHQGAITAESAAGRTRFVLKLPAR